MGKSVGESFKAATQLVARRSEFLEVSSVFFSFSEAQVCWNVEFCKGSLRLVYWLLVCGGLLGSRLRRANMFTTTVQLSQVRSRVRRASAPRLQIPGFLPEPIWPFCAMLLHDGHIRMACVCVDTVAIYPSECVAPQVPPPRRAPLPAFQVYASS